MRPSRHNRSWSNGHLGASSVVTTAVPRMIKPLNFAFLELTRVLSQPPKPQTGVRTFTTLATRSSTFASRNRPLSVTRMTMIGGRLQRNHHGLRRGDLGHVGPLFRIGSDGAEGGCDGLCRSSHNRPALDSLSFPVRDRYTVYAHRRVEGLMGGDQSECRDCGGSLPSDARFCPRCGLALGATLVDPLGLDPVRFGFPLPS